MRTSPGALQRAIFSPNNVELMLAKPKTRLAAAALAIALTACTAPTAVEAPLPAPVARAGHAMWFDAREGLVLFGGYAGQQFFNDTWAARDRRWFPRLAEAPFVARSWQTLAFDPRRRMTVMFGGKDDARNAFGDTWVLVRGKRWREHRGPAPAARSHHTAVHDPARRVVVLFGGDAGGTLFGDTWEFDGKRWRQVARDGPPPRAAHMSAYDPVRGLVIVAGGVAADNETRRDDTWGWDGLRWHRLPDLPRPLALASAAGTDEGVVLFGGWSEGFVPVAHTLVLDMHGWQEADAAGPGARAGAAASFLPEDGVVLLVGGLDAGFAALGDAWLFDGRWQREDALALR